LPIAFSARTLMTCPNIVSDLLMAAPSFNLSPVAPVAPDFSEPAKSTRLMTESFSWFLPYAAMSCLNSMVMMVCARDEVAFMRVEPIVLFYWPCSIFSSMASYESTGCFVKSCT
jgi:hypothetical protein